MANSAGEQNRDSRFKDETSQIDCDVITESRRAPSILEIYEDLSPESAERVLKLVEREQLFEEERARIQFKLKVFQLTMLVLSGLAISLSFIGLTLDHPKATGGWVGALIGLAAGAVIAPIFSQVTKSFQELRKIGRNHPSSRGKHG